MNPLQIKEIKDQKDMLLLAIEDAVDNGVLYSVSQVIPDLKEKIIRNLRLGLFSKKVVDEESLENIVTKEYFQKPKNDYESLLNVSVVELEALRVELYSLGVDYPFFSKDVSDKISGKEIGIEFEYDTFDCNVFIRQVNQKIIDLESLLKIYELRITLPESEVFFNLENCESWQEEYIDIYDNWRWENIKNSEESYIQIGGYGSWIQGSYINNYIAQVNNDVGDAGSVFLLIVDEQITAWVDMY